MVKNTFDGKTYKSEHDYKRLITCFICVKKTMEKNEWLTLDEIQISIQQEWNKFYSITSISARIRDLRKSKFGGYKVKTRRRNDPQKGIFEYKLEN